MLQNFSKAVRDLQLTFRDVFSPYRPELCRREGIAERLLVRPDLCHYFQNSQHTAAELPTPPALWINKGFNNYSAEKVIAIAAEAALEIADATAGIARSWVTSARSFLRISMFQSRSRRRI